MQPLRPDQSRPYTIRTPLTFWLLVMLSAAATAGYTWWDALRAGVPLDMLQLALHSAIVGLVVMIVLTRIEARIAPWRFLR